MNKRGQSMIEYALIAVLIILGTIFMGPYVLRSVNAHFKLWDEGVRDSFTETLNQAPVSDVPHINVSCQCTTTPGSCGSSVDIGTGGCGPAQREYDHICTPQLCDGAPSSACQNDLSCCSDWKSLGCGDFPCPASTCCPGAPVSPPSPGNCYYGQRIKSHQCGYDTSVKCELDSTCPPPACLGIISPGAIPCPNGPPANGVCLLRDNGITYVAGQGDCNPSKTCQYYCGHDDNGNGFFLNPSGTGCTRNFKVAKMWECVPHKGCALSGGIIEIPASCPPRNTSQFYGWECSPDAPKHPHGNECVYCWYKIYSHGTWYGWTRSMNSCGFDLCSPTSTIKLPPTSLVTPESKAVQAVPPRVPPTDFYSYRLHTCSFDGRSPVPGVCGDICCVLGDGCQWEGEPDQQCQINATY